MSRVLLADDSPHAQRMGARILADEGFEIAIVADGDAALARLAEFDADLVLADVALPSLSGYQLCEYLKRREEHRHRRVVLLGSLQDAVDPAEAARVGADGVLQKPFEASVVIEMARHLVARVNPAAVGPVDPEMVRAAVTLAVDAALPALIDELTRRVIRALENRGEA